MEVAIYIVRNLLAPVELSDQIKDQIISYVLVFSNVSIDDNLTNFSSVYHYRSNVELSSRHSQCVP